MQLPTFVENNAFTYQANQVDPALEVRVLIFGMLFVISDSDEMLPLVILSISFFSFHIGSSYLLSSARARSNSSWSQK